MNEPDIVQMLRWCGDGISNQAADEIERLRRLNESLVGRLSAACEVLGRKANKLPLTCPHCEVSITWGWENEP